MVKVSIEELVFIADPVEVVVVIILLVGLIVRIFIFCFILSVVLPISYALLNKIRHFLEEIKLEGGARVVVLVVVGGLVESQLEGLALGRLLRGGVLAPPIFGISRHQVSGPTILLDHLDVNVVQTACPVLLLVAEDLLLWRR